MEGIQVNKYISSSGFCSRREADKLIEQGRVTINNKEVNLGARVSTGDVVAVDGEKIKQAKQAIYIAMNKPVGITSTTDPKDRTNIIYFINYPRQIFPIGRLDKDSEGLILLTNDGDIVNLILRAGNEHEKEYIVTVDKPLSGDFVKKMSGGLPVLDMCTNKCFVKQEGSKRFRIILTQGLNRQIRRMCEFLGYHVVTLKRVRIMNIHLGNIPVGKWRYLTQAELDSLQVQLQHSKNTEEASFIGNNRPPKKDKVKIS